MKTNGSPTPGFAHTCVRTSATPGGVRIRFRPRPEDWAMLILFLVLPAVAPLWFNYEKSPRVKAGDQVVVIPEDPSSNEPAWSPVRGLLLWYGIIVLPLGGAALWNFNSRWKDITLRPNKDIQIKTLWRKPEVRILQNAKGFSVEVTQGHGRSPSWWVILWHLNNGNADFLHQHAYTLRENAQYCAAGLSKFLADTNTLALPEPSLSQSP